MFDDYHTNDFETTNDNIIAIIKNMRQLESKELKRICRKNWDWFMNLTSSNFQDIFWKELEIDYK